MRRPVRSGGFTLVEVAIVLLVLGVLARATLAPLGERLEERRRETTRQRLDDVRRALIGHLTTRGVLPCPLPPSLGASPARTLASDGLAGDASNTDTAPVCTTGHGRVPAAALGVQGAVDADGALLDDWGRPLQYGVTLASSSRAGELPSPDWTTAGEIARVGLEHLDADLVLCRVAASSACPREALRADAVAFVVLSVGADHEARDAGRENVDGDRVYAYAPPSRVEGYRFDDQLVWASRDELAYWLLRAERLP